MIQLVVRQTPFGQVEQTDVVAEFTGECLDEGCFAGSWWTV